MADGIGGDPFSNPMALLYAQYSNPLFAMGSMGGMDPTAMMTMGPKLQTAQGMMQEGISTAPTLSPWAGLSRLAGAIIGPKMLQSLGQQYQQSQQPTADQLKMADEFGTTVYGNVTNPDGSVNHARAMFETMPWRMKQYVMATSATDIAKQYGAPKTLTPTETITPGFGGGTQLKSTTPMTQAGQLVSDYNNMAPGPGKDALGREINAAGIDKGVAIATDPSTGRQYAYVIPGFGQATAAIAGQQPTVLHQGDIPTTPAQAGVTPSAPAAPSAGAPPPSAPGAAPTAPAAAPGTATTAPAATTATAPATAPAVTATAPGPAATAATAPAATAPAATAPAATATAPAGQNLYQRLIQKYNLAGPSTDPKIVEPMLDQIAQRESGGQNIRSRLAEDSSGLYQISKATWNDFNQGFTQYKEAIDAPPDVQREVARRIFAARGEEPWLGSNAGYKATLGGGGSAATAPATTTTAPPASAAGGAPPLTTTPPPTPDEKNVPEIPLPMLRPDVTAPAAGGATGPAAPVTTAPTVAGPTGPAAPAGPLDPKGVDPTNVPYNRANPLQGINPAKITVTPQSPYWPGPRGAGLPVGRDTAAQNTVDQADKEFNQNANQATMLQNQATYRDSIRHALSVLNNAKNDTDWNSGQALHARAEFQNSYNSLMSLLGSPFRADDNMLASVDSFQKASNRLGLEYGSGIGTGAQDIVGDAMVSVPRPALQGQSARLLLSSFDQQAKRASDLRDFQLSVQQDPRSHGILVNSKDEFERLHPTTYYSDMAVYNAIQPKNIQLFEADLRSGRYSPADIEQNFDAQYGAGMAKFAEQQIAQGIYPKL